MNFYLTSTLYEIERLHFELRLKELLAEGSDWFETIYSSEDRSITFVGVSPQFSVSRKCVEFIWANGFNKIYLQSDYVHPRSIFRIHRTKKKVSFIRSFPPKK